MSDDEKLAGICNKTHELAHEAISWITDAQNADLVGPQTKILVKKMKRSAHRARRLEKSARTKMSVSVFGPSQAGKSFLVSVLARPTDGRLTADFNVAGGDLDYIRDINPEGEGESTGLVTRFTMTKAKTPEGFPIKLNLLTQSDVIRTIINSFFMDGDQSEPSPEASELAARLDSFKAKMTSPQPGLSPEEMFEISEYVENTFGRTAYAAALKPFWDDAADIAPSLSLTDRAAFFDVLWGGHEAFTALYIQLMQALETISYAEDVYVSLDALVPRETSIIDVKTLHGLHSGDDGTLQVYIPGGNTIDLSRALVCALAAELVMPMQTQPSEIFGRTDLLDFPGARNRFEQPLTKTLAKPEETITQLLLRGKVAYLFDRYVDNQEITSMLLCIPDSNMETLDLPGLVENWIGMTHGNTPKLRAESNCILFFVMTKFDKHLGESAAGGGEATRFERRIQASLLEKFGRSKDNWVENWTPNSPFQNCYWLRNPNFFVDGLIDYDDNEREIRIRVEKEARVAELKAGCLEALNVQKHFTNPEAAWDAAMSLNDGGVGYLTEQLTKVCTPDSKLRQIRTQISKVTNDILDSISPFYVSDDIEKRIEENRQAAYDVIDSLEDVLGAHRFGAVLGRLCVDQDAIEDRITRVPGSVRISGSAVGASAPVTPDKPGGATRPGRPSRPGRPGRPAVAAAPSEAPVVVSEPDRIRTLTQEMFQSETAIEVWMESLEKWRDDAPMLQAFGMSKESADRLIKELAHAVRRFDLSDKIARKLEEISFGLTIDKQAQPAAIVCAEEINRFVMTLSMNMVVNKERPMVEQADGAKHAVFSNGLNFDTVDNLQVDARPIADNLWTEWVYALEHMFVANAKDSAGGTVNIEQNLQIGQILTSLRFEELQ